MLVRSMQLTDTTATQPQGPQWKDEKMIALSGFKCGLWSSLAQHGTQHTSHSKKPRMAHNSTLPCSITTAQATVCNWNRTQHGSRPCLHYSHYCSQNMTCRPACLPHLVLCVSAEHIQGANSEPELARVCKLANRCAQAHQLVTSNLQDSNTVCNGNTTACQAMQTSGTSMAYRVATC